MNWHFLTDNPLIVLGTSIFVAGFLGSWHCGVMCGPMACFLANKKQLLQYQTGRMLSYTGAGALAGQIVSVFFYSYSWLKYISVVVMAVMLIFLSFKQNENIKLKIKLPFKTPEFLNKFYFKMRNSGFLLGFFSFLLPCGWLWTFIVSAASTRSAFAGALVMFIFWLSTLPALTAAQVVLSKAINKTPVKTQKISSYVLLFASLYSLIMFWFMH